MLQPDRCPRCGGMVQHLQDKDGPYLRCFLGCWGKDLLQAPPEELALRMKVAAHNEGKKAGWQDISSKHDRPDGIPSKDHRIDGYHGPQAAPSQYGGRRHDWWGGTRKRW